MGRAYCLSIHCRVLESGQTCVKEPFGGQVRPRVVVDDWWSRFIPFPTPMKGKNLFIFQVIVDRDLFEISWSVVSLLFPW